MSRVPPELIGLDNAMEDFLSESRRKNERVFEPVGDLWADAHMRFHFPEQFPALPKKKRFSWAGLLAVLAVALVVGWMVYRAVEAF